MVAGRSVLRQLAATTVAGALSAALLIAAPIAASAQSASTTSVPARTGASHAPAAHHPRGDVPPFVLCDTSGDRQGGDDCVRTRLTKDASDGVIAEGKVISARITIHEQLRGRTLVSEVQARRLEGSRVKGQWHTLRTVMWEASTSKATSVRDINVCVAGLQGRYEFRTRTQINGALTRVASSSSTATSTTSSLDINGNSSSCYTSPDDEAIVDYFNIYKGQQGFGVKVHDTGTEFDVTISCATPSRNMPSTMSVALFTHDQTASTTCADQTPIVLTKSTLSSNASCATRSGTTLCEFAVVLYNTQTYSIYSNTLIQITMKKGDQTLTPSLNVASVPVCVKSAPSCLLDGTCALTTNKSATLEVCSSSTCNSTYDYLDNLFFVVYFEEYIPDNR